MLVKHYAGSMLNVDYVELPDGEELVIPDSTINSRVYGTYPLAGNFEIIAADDPSFVGRTFPAGGGFYPIELTCAAVLKAHGDAVWCCVSQTDEERRNISVLTVDGTATLPAHHGFFVVQGQVTADDKVADQFRFFKPRSHLVEVTGSGVLCVFT